MHGRGYLWRTTRSDALSVMSLSFWRTRRMIQTVARAMLLLWAFGLAAGWVNACLLQPGAAIAGHAAPHASAHGTDAPAAAVLDHDAGAGGKDCQRFCDAGSSAIPKLELTALDEPAAALLATASVRVPPVVAARGEPGRRPGPPAPAQVPVPIRFLRLTL